MTMSADVPAAATVQHNNNGADHNNHSTTPAPPSSTVTSTPLAGAAASPAPPTLPTDWQPWRARTIAMYKRDKFHMIGEGTYGSVYLAKNEAGEMVALKKIRKEKREGFPITAIREIKILKSINHANIVNLKDVISSNPYWQSTGTVSAEEKKEWDSSVYMVFEFCDHDLTGLMEAKEVFTAAQTKYYIYNVLSGLHYLHSNRIIHRDIKGANILISNNGDVKIADFGLARVASKGGYTNRVVTLWYRPPELLLGMTDYDYKIDLWSAGCLFAELLNGGQVLFPGNNTELDQLNKIYDICGTPNEQTWPGVAQLKYYQQFTPQPRSRRLRPLFVNKCSKEAVNLLDRLLTLDPNQRISAADALQHPYFTSEEPRMLKASEHPKYSGHHHELASKQNKKRPANQQRPPVPIVHNNASSQTQQQPPHAAQRYATLPQGDNYRDNKRPRPSEPNNTQHPPYQPAPRRPAPYAAYGTDPYRPPPAHQNGSMPPSHNDVRQQHPPAGHRPPPTGEYAAPSRYGPQSEWQQQQHPQQDGRYRQYNDQHNR